MPLNFSFPNFKGIGGKKFVFFSISSVFHSYKVSWNTEEIQNKYYSNIKLDFLTMI